MKPLLHAGLLIFCFFLNAQKLELGKVSIDELKEIAYPADTSAPAAITFKKAKSIFKYRAKTGFYIEHEYLFRIKIYKKEGLDRATFKVPYYTAYEELNADFVEFTDAVTYNLESGKIIKTKTGREGRFKNKINDYWSEAALVLSNVKVGSVVEFRYRLRTEDISEFPTFLFQHDIPMKHCSYNTVIPGFFTYKPLLCGFGNIFNVAKVVHEQQNYNTELNQSASFNYEAVSRDFFAEDIPALKVEPFVDNLENYRSSVKHELEKIQYPNEKEKHYSTIWEAVALDIYKNEKFGNELRERQYFEGYLDPFIKSADQPMQKATAVFNYVQRTMNWDGKYGYLTRKGVRKAFGEKTGNVAEINLMLIAMLNHAGVPAYPVLVSTVDNGIAAFPNRGIFNYVIASAEINGRVVLFDATSKNTAPDILPLRDLNWHGWRIATDGKAMQVDLAPKTLSHQVVTVMAKVDAAGAISGKARLLKADYCGLRFRENYKGVNQENYVEKLERDLGNAEISNYSVEIPDDTAQQVAEKFDFSSGAAEVIGDKIYIDPLLLWTETKNPFVSEGRLLPIYFGFPQAEKYNITIEIPQGYTVESLPKSTSQATPENVAAYKMNIQQQQNIIQLSVSNEIKQAIVSSGFYETLKSYYGKVVQSGAEKIVLKKI